MWKWKKIILSLLLFLWLWYNYIYIFRIQAKVSQKFVVKILVNIVMNFSLFFYPKDFLGHRYLFFWLPFHKTLFHKTPFPKEPTKRNLSQRNPPKNTHIKKAPIIRIHLTHFWYISDGWNRDKITPFSSLDNFLEHKSQIF